VLGLALTLALAFALPTGWKSEPAADVSAEHAWRLLPPAGAAITSATLLAGGKRTDDLEGASAEWHSAHVRNRAAWGMRLQGGAPREAITVGGRRALRYRDRVSGALGAGEQTMTCVLAGGALACVLATAPEAARDAVDELAAHVLASLKNRR
jgi:hypothetical protein